MPDTEAEAAEGVDGGLGAMYSANGPMSQERANRLARNHLNLSSSEDAGTVGEVLRRQVISDLRNPPPAFLEAARFQPTPHGTVTHARADVEWVWRAMINQFLGLPVDG